MSESSFCFAHFVSGVNVILLVRVGKENLASLTFPFFTPMMAKTCRKPLTSKIFKAAETLNNQIFV